MGNAVICSIQRGIYIAILFICFFGCQKENLNTNADPSDKLALDSLVATKLYR
jgi:hypothetical protein